MCHKTCYVMILIAKNTRNFGAIQFLPLKIHCVTVKFEKAINDFRRGPKMPFEKRFMGLRHRLQTWRMQNFARGWNIAD